LVEIIATFASHDEAEQATLAYYRQLTPAERLEILLELIEAANAQTDAASQGLARVYRIAQLSAPDVVLREGGSPSESRERVGSDVSDPYNGPRKPL
jgi:hypothetical protein